MSSEEYHESLDDLTHETHRAISSLVEELEAVDWYQQRVDATKDEELRAILAHNRDEEKEHAAMVLEWLRRRDDFLNQQLKTYLFTEGQVTEVEKADDEAAGPDDGSLGIGSLRNRGESI